MHIAAEAGCMWSPSSMKSTVVWNVNNRMDCNPGTSNSLVLWGKEADRFPEGEALWCIPDQSPGLIYPGTRQLFWRVSHLHSFIFLCRLMISPSIFLCLDRNEMLHRPLRLNFLYSIFRDCLLRARLRCHGNQLYIHSKVSLVSFSVW